MEQIISVEMELTQAEERHDIDAKQRLENEFVHVLWLHPLVVGTLKAPALDIGI